MPPPRLLLVIATLTLGGCLSEISRPTLPAIDEQARFSTSIPLPDKAQGELEPWWQRATPKEIWQPLEQALVTNPDLRQASANIAAAQARLEQAEAALGPDLTMDATAQTRRSSGETTNSRSLGIDGDVPIDINNALSERRRAARFAHLARIAEHEQLRSDLARDYLLALLEGSEAKQLSLLIQQQLEVANTLLRLIELRFTQGLASSVDVLQQRDQLAALRQQVPQARLDAITANNRLRLIAAQTPGVILEVGTDTLPEVSNGFADVEPASLIQRRGQLRASQADIRASARHWLTGGQH